MFLPMSSLVMLLYQMETIRPMSDDEFTTIDGVGKAKLENMDAFIKAIITFQKTKLKNLKKKLAPIKKHYYYFKMDLQLGDRIKT
jgi:ATP-dependent DNA helicase RecQ